MLVGSTSSHPESGSAGVGPTSVVLGRRRRGWSVRLVAVVAMALGLVASGCGSPERPTLVERASTGSTAPTESTASPEAMVSRRRPNPDDTASTTSTPTTAVATTPSAVPSEVEPPPPGVGAVLSPSGVLVRVTGVADGGYVVQTPCGNPALLAWGTPVGPVQVVLDPGHGGESELGAVGSTGLTEAELNLDLSRRTAAELTSRSISVALTRNGDYRIPIRIRAELADALAPSAFVSIHHNTPASAPSPTPGSEVFVQSSSEQSRRLGGVVYESVIAALSGFDVEWTARSDAGVLTVLNGEGSDAYGINRYPSTPSALVEMAYLGNPLEEALLMTEDYLDAASVALADGIQRYLETDAAGSGYVDTPRNAEPQSDTGGTSGCVDPPLG